MKLSTVSLEQWLDSTAHGFMPDGRAVRVIRVLDGDIVEVWVSGGQHFGSGGFYAGAVYAGNKPTRSRAGRTARTECVSEESEMLQFTGPCVVFSYSGDGINGGRCLRREVFLCATSDQIAQARRRVRRPMTPRGLVVVGDGEVAVNTTAANVLAYGTYTAGQECPPTATFLADGESVEVVEADHRGRDPVRYLVVNRDGEVEVGLHPKEVEARKQFARDQHERLVELGFTPKHAHRIIRAAGPGRAMPAAEWARGVSLSSDALELLLTGALRAPFGRGRIADAFEAVGAPLPAISSADGLTRFIAGAYAAVVPDGRA